MKKYKIRSDYRISDTKVKISLYIDGGGIAVKEFNLFDGKDMVNKLDKMCATMEDFELDDSWVIIK